MITSEHVGTSSSTTTCQLIDELYSYLRDGAAVWSNSLPPVDLCSPEISFHWTLSSEKNIEKALRETQTLRVGCSKAEPKISPHHRPFPDARTTSYRVNSPTNTPTNTHTQTNNPHTWPIRIHCAAASLARSVIRNFPFQNSVSYRCALTT